MQSSTQVSTEWYVISPEPSSHLVLICADYKAAKATAYELGRGYVVLPKQVPWHRRREVVKPAN